jgi:hypothetical protein
MGDSAGRLVSIILATYNEAENIGGSSAES